MKTMEWSDDPVLDAERYMRALDLRVERRPKCHCCGKRIQDDEALHYDGGLEDIWLCLGCVEDKTEYIEEDE